MFCKRTKFSGFGKECIIFAPLVVPNRIAKVPIISKQIFITFYSASLLLVSQTDSPAPQITWLVESEVTMLGLSSTSMSWQCHSVKTPTYSDFKRNIFMNVQTSLLKNAFYFSRSSCNVNVIFLYMLAVVLNLSDQLDINWWGKAWQKNPFSHVIDLVVC